MTARLTRASGLYARAWRGFQPDARRYLLASLLFGLGVQMFSFLFSLYLLALGYDEILIGRVAAATSVGTVLGSIPAGLVYRRWGGRWAFVVGIIGACATYSLQILTRTPLAIVAVALGAGITNSFLWTMGSPFIADVTNVEERAYLVSLSAIAATIAQLAGSLLGGNLPRWAVGLFRLHELAAGYRVSMVLSILLTLVALIPTLALRHGPSGGPPRGHAPFGHGASEPRSAEESSQASLRGFVGGAVVIFFSAIAIGATLPFYAAYFTNFHGLNSIQVGYVMSLAHVAGLTSLFVMPGYIGRLGLVRVNLWVGLLASPCLVALGLRMPFPAMVGFFLAGYALFRVNKIFYSNLMMEVVAPSDRGTQAGIRSVVDYLTRAAVGVIGGWLIVRFGYVALFALAGGAELVAGVATWVIFRKTRAALPRASIEGPAPPSSPRGG